MKTRFLLFLLLLATYTMAANDTLTRAQVYNFNVGDTFDYKVEGGITDYPSSYSKSYRRQVVKQVYSLVDTNTLYIVKETVYPFPAITDTIIVNNLSVYETLSKLDSNCFTHQFDIDTSSGFNNRTLNSLSSNCFEHNKAFKHVEGLGEVYMHFQGGASPDPNFFHDEELIYYSKGSEQWGIPIFNTQHLVHYTPIPEECAVWTSKIYGDFPPLTQNHLSIVEQIQSGNRIGYNGHAYIEMIYRSYDYDKGYFTPDSLIGYYRNDTLNRKLLFYVSVADTLPFLSYDFSYACPDPNCLSQVMVGGELRTRWPNYIEGVGGVVGLLPVKRILYPTPGGNPPYWYAVLLGKLSSFCVCGQVMYAADSTATCNLISDVPFFQSVSAALYPNPAGSRFTLQLPSMSKGDTYFGLYDAMGQKVKQQAVMAAQTVVDRGDLPGGIYYWQLTDNGNVVGQGKLILE